MKESISITGVWIRCSGARIQLLVEIDGVFRLVNDEPNEGFETVVSHITEPCGIEKAPIDPLRGTA